jgi:hypothetical protein
VLWQDRVMLGSPKTNSPHPRNVATAGAQNANSPRSAESAGAQKANSYQSKRKRLSRVLSPSAWSKYFPSGLDVVVEDLTEQL